MARRLPNDLVGISTKQRAFVEAYLLDSSPSAAARAAVTRARAFKDRG